MFEPTLGRQNLFQLMNIVYYKNSKGTVRIGEFSSDRGKTLARYISSGQFKPSRGPHSNPSVEQAELELSRPDLDYGTTVGGDQ